MNSCIALPASVSFLISPFFFFQQMLLVLRRNWGYLTRLVRVDWRGKKMRVKQSMDWQTRSVRHGKCADATVPEGESALGAC